MAKTILAETARTILRRYRADLDAKSRQVSELEDGQARLLDRIDELEAWISEVKADPALAGVKE